MLADKKIINRWNPYKNPEYAAISNPEPDWIANEVILSIVVNQQELTNFSCSPDNLEEMAVGFIFSSGIISNLNEIAQISTCKDNFKVNISLKKNIPFNFSKWQKNQTITSGCGQGKSINIDTLRKMISEVEGSFQIEPQYLCELFSDLKIISQGYNKTGCIHSAALICKEGNSVLREDIGRHNAIDKVIGAGLRLSLDFSKYILCCSGRISSEMILKAGKAGIPIVASRAAPTSLAVDIASELNITLIGFVRGLKFNIYSHPERITFNNDVTVVKEDEYEKYADTINNN